MAPNAEEYEWEGQYHTLVATKDQLVGYDVLRQAQNQPDWIRSVIEPGDDLYGRPDYFVYFSTAIGLQAVYDYIELKYPDYVEDDGYYFGPID